MKFIKALDVWAYGRAITTGQIKLQPGQWVRLGHDGQLSRFHHTNGRTITCFHGDTPAMATRKFLYYCAAIAERNAMIAKNRAARLATEAAQAAA
jgi:hypothetical protein